jgi:MFS superfamily sulfate permease-like transporter
MNGIALTVLISQLPKLFGFSISADGPLRESWAIVQGIVSGKANWIAFAIGAGALAIILLLRNNKRVPGILIAVVVATVIAAALNLAERSGVSVLGSLPRGLPAFTIPWITYADIVPIVIGGFAVALVSFADTSRPVSRLCRPDGNARRSQSGDGRARSCQSVRRLLSRFPDQQQFLAYPGCRGGRR